MLEQAIVGVLRPRLRFSDQYYSQAHLIEHLLFEQGRLARHGLTKEWLNDKVIRHDAFINEHFEVEYFVVLKRWAERLLRRYVKIAEQFDWSDEETDKERRIIIEEMTPRRRIISLAEQWARACLEPNLKRRWDNASDLRRRLTAAETKKLAGKLARPIYPFLFSFDEYQFPHGWPQIRGKRYLDFDGRRRRINHPDAGLERDLVVIAVPLEVAAEQQVTLRALTYSLRDPQLGYLYDIFRHQEGRLYDFGLSYSVFTKTLEFSFYVTKKQAPEMIKRVEELVCGVEFQNWLSRHYQLIVDRFILYEQLAWGDIGPRASGYIGYSAMTGDQSTPKEEQKRLAKNGRRWVEETRQHLVSQLSYKRLIQRGHGKRCRQWWED